jgi:hypothetical protein
LKEQLKYNNRNRHNISSLTKYQKDDFRPQRCTKPYHAKAEQALTVLHPTAFRLFVLPFEIIALAEPKGLPPMFKTAKISPGNCSIANQYRAS